MKVFISWSGVSSRILAEALHEWIPKVVQGVRPFLSTKDIDKGAIWASVLNGELQDCAFGIVCLTAENLMSPWLNYEAGAIVSAVSSRVCPVLLGITKDQVQAPLSQLQLTEISLAEITQLMQSVNRATNEPLDQAAVREAVETWWPKLESQIDAIPLPSTAPSTLPTEPEKPELTNDDALQEILRSVRFLESRVSVSENGSRSLSRNSTRHADSELTRFYYVVGREMAIHGVAGNVVTSRRGPIVQLPPSQSPLPTALLENLSLFAKAYGLDLTIQEPDGRIHILPDDAFFGDGTTRLTEDESETSDGAVTTG